MVFLVTRCLHLLIEIWFLTNYGLLYSDVCEKENNREKQQTMFEAGDGKAN